MPNPLATLTDRLYADYQPGVTHAEIDRVVYQCRIDLAGTPPTALPELLERLARQRLTDQRENATIADTQLRPVRDAGAGLGPDQLHRSYLS
jgi:hypothetical protein